MLPLVLYAAFEDITCDRCHPRLLYETRRNTQSL